MIVLFGFFFPHPPVQISGVVNPFIMKPYQKCHAEIRRVQRTDQKLSIHERQFLAGTHCIQILWKFFRRDLPVAKDIVR